MGCTLVKVAGELAVRQMPNSVAIKIVTGSCGRHQLCSHQATTDDSTIGLAAARAGQVMPRPGLRAYRDRLHKVRNREKISSMTDSHKPHKLYCYVDETGQDTLGKLFVVVAVVAGDERQQLIDFLETAEHQSGGRRKQQWSKCETYKRREKYLDAAFTSVVRGKIFFEVFKGSTDFEQMTGHSNCSCHPALYQ